MQIPSQAYIQLLAKKKLMGTISEQEDAILNQWIEDKSSEELDTLGEEEKALLKERLLHRIMKDAGIRQSVLLPVRSRKKRMYRWVAAASLLFLILGSAFYFLNMDNKNQSSPNASVNKTGIDESDVAPGKNGAILTLSNGKKVVLDNMEDGVIAEESNRLLKKEGRLVYGEDKNRASSEIVYNTLTTPRARAFQIILSDGTKVWLNAESSITYPTDFRGNDRSVTITGEAYFEVTKDVHHPFVVRAENAEIKVLGTHFNVMAYPEEGQIKTTLLEGSVEVSNRHDKRIIKPGQQAGISTMDESIRVSTVDTDNVVAWINGKLSLDDLDVQMIMQKLSRWYDVDIRYEGVVSKERYWGVVNREVSLQNMLKVLSANGINAKYVDNTVVIGRDK